MKNLIKIFIFTFSLTFFILFSYTRAEISIKKNVIVWRYKSVNGKIYKRKYNITLKKWVGPWIEASLKF